MEHEDRERGRECEYVCNANWTMREGELEYRKGAVGEKQEWERGWGEKREGGSEMQQEGKEWRRGWQERQEWRARVGRVEGCWTVVRFARHVAGLTQPLLDPPLASFLLVYPALSPCMLCCGDPSGQPVTLASTTISTGERRYTVSVLVAAEQRRAAPRRPATPPTQR